MPYLVRLIVIAGFLASSSATLDAQGRSGGHAGGPKVTAPHGPKTAPTQSGPKTTTSRGPKTVRTSNPKTAGPKAGTSANSGVAAARGKKAVTTPTTTGARTSGSMLPSNPRLVERLRSLLPPGTDMTAAATGFKNQGQFVAAVHVSNNLGVPFAELRTRMVDQNLSLGQAIQQLRPTVDAESAARRATEQADDDLATPRRPRRGSQQ